MTNQKCPCSANSMTNNLYFSRKLQSVKLPFSNLLGSADCSRILINQQIILVTSSTCGLLSSIAKNMNPTNSHMSILEELMQSTGELCFVQSSQSKLYGLPDVSKPYEDYSYVQYLT